MTVRVIYNPTTPHGRILAEAVDRLIDGESSLERVKRAMDAMRFDTGSGETWSQVETELGLANGTGQAVYNLVDAALTALQVNAIRNACIRLDQG